MYRPCHYCAGYNCLRCGGKGYKEGNPDKWYNKKYGFWIKVLGVGILSEVFILMTRFVFGH